MIIDARSSDQNKTLVTDVCIVGGGTAGITLAREFIGQGFSVCLLESGGLKPDKETQALQWGKNIGHPYYSLDTARPRYLGGTTNRWHLAIGDDCSRARMKPFDEIDFEERDWVPYSGWPFPKSHLDPFYDRAQSVCRIEPATFDVEAWEDSRNRPHLQFKGDGIKTVIFKFGSRYPFIKDYIEQIDQAPNISTYLHANIVEIETDALSNNVTRLRVATLNGKRFWVKAKIYILAAGAIEISRLLLVSNKVQKTGLGNQHDLVGRFFMEHPHCTAGLFVPSNQDIFKSTGLYNTIHVVNGVPIKGKVSFSGKLIRRERLLNQVVEFYPRLIPKAFLSQYPIVDAKSVHSLRALVRHEYNTNDLWKHVRNIFRDFDDTYVAGYRIFKSKIFSMLYRDRIKVFEVQSMSEQIPNPQSRVMLTNERDHLGMNRVNLDWQLTPYDIQSIIRGLKILDDQFRHSGLGRVYCHLYDEIPSQSIYGGWHHMGTTRMDVDPKKGVVDENCKVHGTHNLFIAGPSVFPTGGYANPILTIVALSIRLADHVKKTFDMSGR
jgi:choline dehydrogenase-like flavoprotein